MLRCVDACLNSDLRREFAGADGQTTGTTEFSITFVTTTLQAVVSGAGSESLSVDTACPMSKILEVLPQLPDQALTEQSKFLYLMSEAQTLAHLASSMSMAQAALRQPLIVLNSVTVTNSAGQPTATVAVDGGLILLMDSSDGPADVFIIQEGEVIEGGFAENGDFGECPVATMRF